MPRLKPGTILLAPEEDAAITAAALSNPDAGPLTDEEWASVQPRLRLGRPRAAARKISTTIRFDADLLAVLKASGLGRQTRVNAAMRTMFMKQPAA